ncbi:response regulator [Kosmotoga pacifica]|uniref:histidine kinase n=1 Tax=Kosmotoga pacifica TaxID=1330330 RepID=A0A0G2Z7C8_9BACT|nr:response regulator [Kosmotoga pacifica]AKI97447.1 hypothetical protein IX53_06020 [Kosmotoga pacifica]
MRKLSRKVSVQFFLFILFVLVFIGVFTFLSFMKASREEYTNYLEAKKQDIYSWFIDYKKSLRDNLQFFLENGRLLPGIQLLIEYRSKGTVTYKNDVNFPLDYESLEKLNNTFYAHNGELFYLYIAEYGERKFLIASKIGPDIVEELSNSLGKDALVFIYKDGFYIIPEEFKELEIYPPVVKKLYENSNERPVGYDSTNNWIDRLLPGENYLVDKVDLVGAEVYILQSQKLLTIFQKRFAYMMFIVTAGVLLFSYIFSTTLNAYISRALKSIIEGFESIKQGKFKKVNLKSRDELQIIAQELNETMEFIKNTLEKLRLSNEQLKKASKEAQQANRMKSEFLANMSHEMRTPMNAILGFTELLMSDETNTEKRKYLSTIYKSGEHLLNLINDVLDLSKIESGKFEIIKVPYSPRELLKDLVETYIPLASSKELHLAYNADESLPEYLLGDEFRIRQILTNLISNSIKFTEKGYVTIRAVDRVEAVDFVVKDTGIGIPAKDLERIFEPFTQLDGTMSRKYGGTGLGLTITKRLVELLGGRLFIKSEPGSGTEVTVRFKKEIPTIVDSREQMNIEEDSPFLLLVTQDNELLENFGSTFTRHGIKYRYTNDLELAKLLLNNQNFSLVILDICTIDNKERAKELLGELNVPFIILAENEKSYPEFESHIITKPVLEDRLINRIYNVVEKSRKALFERKARILVVEDNEANRLLFKKVLEKAGHMVEVAENGKVAIEKVKNGIFDIVFMDMQMPVMDGYTATRKIRELGIKIPIIALTAHTMRGDEEKALKAGCNGYLGKPVKRKEILDTVYRFLMPDESNHPDEKIEKNGGLHGYSSDRITRFARKMGLSLEEASTMFQEYGKFIEERIDYILKKLEDKDFEAIAREGHSLKGSGTMYSVEEISELGLEIEEFAKAGKIDLLLSRVEELKKLKKKLWN